MISDNSFFGCGLGRMEKGRPDEISIATTAQEPQPSIAAIPFFFESTDRAHVHDWIPFSQRRL
jgi:hypothetical protein